VEASPSSPSVFDTALEIGRVLEAWEVHWGERKCWKDRIVCTERDASKRQMECWRIIRVRRGSRGHKRCVEAREVYWKFARVH